MKDISLYHTKAIVPGHQIYSLNNFVTIHVYDVTSFREMVVLIAYIKQNNDNIGTINANILRQILRIRTKARQII